MDPETKKILDENIALAKENNVMLKRLVHGQKMLTIYRVVYWSIIILSTLGVYYFIQPFLGNLLNVYSGGASADSGSTSSSFSDVFKNLSNKNQMQDLINTIKQ